MLKFLGVPSSQVWIAIRPTVFAIVVVVVNALESEQGVQFWVKSYTAPNEDGVQVYHPAHLGLDAKVILGIIASSVGIDYGKRKTTMKVSGKK